MTHPSTARSGVFVNYRRDDTGWAANALADALRRRLGPGAVFLDNSSIGLGRAFAQELEDGVRRSAALVALIGPGWDEPPLLDRLFDDQDWVRRELRLADDHGVLVVPVLVDRSDPPRPTRLPEPLRFVAALQCARLRQTDPGDLDLLAGSIVAALPPSPPVPPRRAGAGVARSREEVDGHLRHILPPVQQWSGNRQRLTDLVLAVLGPEERLLHLAPARLEGRPAGSATVLVTSTDLVVVDVEESFRIRGEVRIPLGRIGRVEVAPTLPLFADVVVRTTAGDTVPLLGLFREQARRVADLLRS